MAFILDKDIPWADRDVKELRSRYDAYLEYLASVRGKLPPRAYEFAVAPWHYDHDYHQCPHDSWVESLTISEPFTGERRQYREIEINVRLLGAFHDGHIEIKYTGVRSYSLETPPEFKLPPGFRVGHGDWLIDEVRLSERELVLHEIEFSRGSRWVIECGDIDFQWRPFESAGPAI